MQYIYSKKMFTGRAKPIWIVGDPDKWSSTAISVSTGVLISP